MRTTIGSCAFSGLAIFGTGALLAQPSAPQRMLVEEVRIDAVREDLTSVGFVLVDRSGRIIISQPEDFRILFFGADGRRLGSFGRQGQGPGEFAARANSAPLPAGQAGGGRPPRALISAGLVGDTVWLYDNFRRRFSFVSPTGSLLRSGLLAGTLPTLHAAAEDRGRAKRADSLLSSFSPLAVYSNGDLLGQAGFRSAARVVPDIRIGSKPPEFVRTSESGSSLRRLGAMPDNPSSVEISRNNGDYGIGGAIPFVTEPSSHVAQDGSRIAILSSAFLSGAQGEARLVVLDAVGDTLVSRAYPFTGRSIPRAESDSFIRMQINMHLREPSSMPGRRQMVADLERELVTRAPAYRSPFGLARLGLDDTIWLRLSWGGMNGEASYLMLDGKGDAIGSVKLPPRTNFMAGSRTHLWVMSANDDGLTGVVRYRIQAP